MLDRVESKTPAQDVASWRQQNAFLSSTTLLKLVFQYLDAEHLTQLANEEKVNSIGIGTFVRDALEAQTKKPTYSDIIKLFSKDDFWQVLPSLTAQLPEKDQYTSSNISQLAPASRHTVESEITDASGQLCLSSLIRFLQENKGMTCTEEQIITAFFNHRRDNFKSQILQALSASIDDEGQLVTPQPVVPKLAEMLQGFCLLDQKNAAVLLREVDRHIKDKGNLESETSITEHPTANHLLIYVATCLVKHMPTLLQDDCEYLLNAAYKYNLLCLFQAFIEREDVCAWINKVSYGRHFRTLTLVQAILSSADAKDLQQILMSSPACLRPIAGTLNYLFLCCRENLPLAPVLQSQFADDLARQCDQKNSVIHSTIEAGDAVQSVKDLIQRYPHLLNQKGNNGLTPLHCGVKNLQMKVVFLLLEQKEVNVEVENENNEDIFFTAVDETARATDSARSSGKNILSKLISHPAATSLLTVRDDKRPSAVIFACERGLPDIARQIQARLNEILKTTPESKWALDASINARTQILEGHQVSVLEYAVKTRSTDFSNTLNLIVAGAECKLSDNDHLFLEALTREIVQTSRTDALEPFYQFCKQSGQEKAMLTAMQYCLNVGYQFEIFTPFVSTYKSFAAKDLENLQTSCIDRITQFINLNTEFCAIESGQRDKIRAAIERHADLIRKFKVYGKSYFAIQAMQHVVGDKLKELMNLHEEVTKQQAALKAESDRPKTRPSA